ncbi:MAG: hypothetical protein HY695_33615 [Deltaproteobacteria bacterium]|nr:hypothetical protein [Deltaproteobacteria bacterium]
MTDLPLTLGLDRAPNTEALFDGSIEVRGIALRLRSSFAAEYDNVGARHRSIIAGEIEGGELSISSFILARLRKVPLRALPVFLSRRFRHRCMFCAVETPLEHPSQLAGKKVTVHRYNATTPVWLKGILENDYGVRPDTVEWHVAEPDIEEESLHGPPPQIQQGILNQRPELESLFFPQVLTL